MALAAFAFLQLGTASRAAGVTHIQQADGSIKVYNDIRMHLKGHTLWITSSDGKGTLEVRNSACSYVGDVKRCLPDAVTLHQFGRDHKIALDHGTVYLNLTGSDQPLPLSSKHIAANSLLILMKTARGTYVSVRGTLDEVTK
jgi:hypothetical protein